MCRVPKQPKHLFAENVTEVNDRSLSRLEVIQKSKLRSPRSSRFEAQLISSRAQNIDRVFLRRASKYATSKLFGCVVVYRMNVCGIVYTMDVVVTRCILSSRGEGTISSMKRECVVAWIQRVNSPAVCILACNPRGSNRRQLGYVSLARGATGWTTDRARS